MKSLHLLSVVLVVLAMAELRSASAAVVSSMVLGSTQSEFNGQIVLDESSLALDAIQSVASRANSGTLSNLAWQWTGTELTASSSVLAAKSLFSFPLVSNHSASSNLTLQFTIDSRMTLNFSGNWGFLGTSGSNELASFSLVGPGGNVVSDSTSSSSGVNSDSFAFSGILDPGSYIFEIDISLSESIFLLGTREGGFNLNEFQLRPVPEPSMIGPLMLILCLTIRFRRKPRLKLACPISR